MKRFRNNYTLIEILVVLGIMAILTAIGTAGIRGLTGSAGVTGAVRNLSSQLSMGRSYAVSHNRYVAVLFPDDKITSDKDKLKDYPFRQSRLCYVDSSYKFQQWIPESTWQHWPKGVAVCIADNEETVTGVDISVSSGVVTKDLSAVIYKPSGTLVNVGSNSDVEILIFPASGKISTTAWKFTQENRDAGWTTTINPFTGKASYAKK